MCETITSAASLVDFGFGREPHYDTPAQAAGRRIAQAVLDEYGLTPWGPRTQEKEYERLYSAAGEAVLADLYRERADARTVADLLRLPEGRAAVRALAHRRYSAETDALARRPVVGAADKILTARAQRATARKVADAARTVAPGRMVRVLEALQAARAAKLEAKIATAVTAATAGLYRVSRSSWAGGDHTTRVTVGAPSCSGGSSRAWSSNGKWSGCDSSHAFTVPATWPETVAAHDLEVVDGMLTLDAEPVQGHGPELYRAVWAEQARGFDLNAVRGYIARQDGRAYHAPSARAALDGLARKLGRKPARRKGTPDLDRLARRHGDLPVTFADREGLACVSGSRSWCHAVGIDPDGVATVADLVRGYKLRPLPEVIAVLRRVVRDRRNRGPVEATLPASSLERETGRVVFDAEGGFRIEPSAN